jgi:hydrogenase maturation factor
VISQDACGSDHCITCADDGAPMTVVRIEEPGSLAVCRREDGEPTSVETALVEPVAVGDLLLVHAGTAIAFVDPIERSRNEAPA